MLRQKVRTKKYRTRTDTAARMSELPDFVWERVMTDQMPMPTDPIIQYCESIWIQKTPDIPASAARTRTGSTIAR